MKQSDLNEQRVRDRAYHLWEADGSPHGMADTYWHRARIELGEEEQAFDELLEDTFPASDAPAHSGIAGPARSTSSGAPKAGSLTPQLPAIESLVEPDL